MGRLEITSSFTIRHYRGRKGAHLLAGRTQVGRDQPHLHALLMETMLATKL